MCSDTELLDAAFWDDIPDDVQQELLRQGEEAIKGTVAVAVAADQRAATTMGYLWCGRGRAAYGKRDAPSWGAPGP